MTEPWNTKARGCGPLVGSLKIKAEENHSKSAIKLKRNNSITASEPRPTNNEAVLPIRYYFSVSSSLAPLLLVLGPSVKLLSTDNAWSTVQHLLSCSLHGTKNAPPSVRHTSKSTQHQGTNRIHTPIAILCWVSRQRKALARHKRQHCNIHGGNYNTSCSIVLVC
jgi:hypothetical protein